MRTLVIALLALVLVPSLAQAGGGTKATGRITVRNDSAETAGVIVNSTLPATATQQQFLDAGGKFLAQGEIATFSNLKAGNNIVSAFYVNAAGTVRSTVGTRTVNLKNGQTVNLKVTGTSATTATIAPR